MITDGHYPCDHGRMCMIECPQCAERRERQKRLDALSRRSRLRVIEGGDGQSTKQFRETLALAKRIADEAREDAESKQP